MRKILLSLCLFLLGLGQVFGQAPLTPTNLHYVGSFRLPRGKQGMASCAYAMGTLAYNKQGNTLFLVGRETQSAPEIAQAVAEIAIPATLGTGTLNTLPITTVVQPFAEATDNKLHPGNDTTGYKIYGMLVVTPPAPAPTILLINSCIPYDANNTQSASLFTRPLALSTVGQVQGPYKIGTDKVGITSGWLGDMSPSLADPAGSVIAGQGCISIISRTSLGPAGSIFSTKALGSSLVLAQVLINYPSTHPTLGGYGNPYAFTTAQPTPLFSGASQIRGIAVTSTNLLYFGHMGRSYWYGPGDAGPNGAKDPPYLNAKGDHGPPYFYCCWSYKISDVMPVAQGLKQPWDPVPEMWDLNKLLPDYSDPTRPNSQRHEIGGVAFDRDNSLIYLSLRNLEMVGGEPYGIISVLKIQ